MFEDSKDIGYLQAGTIYTLATPKALGALFAPNILVYARGPSDSHWGRIQGGAMASEAKRQTFSEKLRTHSPLIIQLFTKRDNLKKPRDRQLGYLLVTRKDDSMETPVFLTYVAVNVGKPKPLADGFWSGWKYLEA